MDIAVAAVVAAAVAAVAAATTIITILQYTITVQDIINNISNLTIDINGNQ